jgi:hypothetical protein
VQRSWVATTPSSLMINGVGCPPLPTEDAGALTTAAGAAETLIARHVSPRAPKILAAASAAALAALVLVAAAPSASADVVFDGRWRTPGLNAWDARVSEKPGNRNKLAFVRSPRRAGSVFSADLRVGGNPDSERINFVKSPLFADAEGRDTWIAWSTYIPAGANLPAAPMSNQVNMVALFSKFNVDYCPPAGAATEFFLYGNDPDKPANRWRVALTGGTGTCELRYKDIAGLGVPRRKWIDWLCHFRWSASPGSALSKCHWRVQPHRAWRLGFADTGPNLVRSPDVPGSLSIHYGLYKGEARPYVHLVQGGLVVASTRADAVRAAFAGAGSAPGGSDRRALLIAAGAIVAVLALIAGRMLVRNTAGVDGRRADPRRRHRRLRHH